MSNQLQRLVDDFWEATLLKIIPLNIKPNHFTFLRLALTPVILYFLATQHFYIALMLFVLASLSDSIDGSLARKRHQISEFGITLDPLADKLLIILSALFLFYYYPYFKILLITVIIDILILAESVIIVVYNHSLKTPPSNWTGKGKMTFQVLALFSIFVFVTSQSIIWLQVSLMFLYLVILTGLMSLVNYGYKSYKIIKLKK